MIKKKNNTLTVLYLTDSTLSVQTEKKVLLKASFPKDLVDDKKVVDVEALEAFIFQKIKKITGLKSVKTLVIGKGLLFQTAVPLDDISGREEHFFSSIPFEKSDIAERRVKTATKEYILVTSKKFYAAVIGSLQKMDIEIASVVPLSLFVDEVDEDALKPDDLKAILSKEDLYSKANFLDSPDSLAVEEKASDKGVEEDMQNEVIDDHIKKVPSAPLPYTLVKKWNMTALLVILGFLVVSTLIFGVFLFVEQKRFMNNASTPQEAVITPSPTPVVEKEVDKGSLTVSILNGTGTPGQAGRAKDAIEKIGYNSVETGNSDDRDNTKTTVSFSKKVSSSQADEVVKSLEEVFSEVIRATDEDLTHDIVVVTGEEK